MNHIKDIIPKVLTEMRTMPTRDVPTSIQPPQKKARREPTFEDFKTFKESCLERMLQEAKTFLESERENLKPFWLSFFGTSGGGKTFLSNIVFNESKHIPHIANHPTLITGAHKASWPNLISKLYQGEHWRIDDLRDANLLFLDDIAKSADKTGFERECLWRLLSDRVGKWTILTSNLMVNQIAEELDIRIASRLSRDGNIAIEVETTDFFLR